ncbi:MAG TPA: prepilin peptidase [Chloroflexota bacterium]|jgi:prepilin signal peptidase PulO-like enzyme (type II secretory pathway)|nr:prepilin peptidase [Chloroflexota bacterium]
MTVAAPAALMPTLVLLGVLGLATAFDLRSHRVPAWLTAGSIVGALAGAALAGPDRLQQSVIGALAGGLVFLPFTLRGWLGGADALLLAAAGAWHGWHFALWTAWWASLVGAALALCLWYRHRHDPAARRRPFPYVPAILAGAIVTLLTHLPLT